MLNKPLLFPNQFYFGLEMVMVYSALGVDVTVVEFMDQLIPGVDVDLVNVLQKCMSKKGVKFLLKTKVI